MTSRPDMTADPIDRLLHGFAAVLRDVLAASKAHPSPEGEPAALERARRAMYASRPPDTEADAIHLASPHPPAQRGFVFADPKPFAFVPPLPRLAQFRQTAATFEPLPPPLPPADPAIEREADKIANRTALGVLAQIKANPRFVDVVTYLLTPLVERDLLIDGNAEAILTRRATEFADYTPRILSAAARHLCNGRHAYFPEPDEIYAALGKVSRPGYAGADLTNATKAA